MEFNKACKGKVRASMHIGLYCFYPLLCVLCTFGWMNKQYFVLKMLFLSHFNQLLSQAHIGKGLPGAQSSWVRHANTVCGGCSLDPVRERLDCGFKPFERCKESQACQLGVHSRERLKGI